MGGEREGGHGSARPAGKGGLSAGQLLLVGFRPEEEDEVLSLAADGRLGGVILFGRNGQDAMEVARLCVQLRDAARQGGSVLPMVAVDQEQGRVCRILKGVTRFPGAAVLGELDHPPTTERVARWVNLEMAAAGVHWNLAPVADVSQRDKPSKVLGGRTFGHDPTRVAGHVTAWIGGSQGARVAACVKHFPGHGSVREDSHTVLPRDPAPLEQMRELHLRPFSAAIDAGVAAVMVGHVAYDALDPGIPASLSPGVIQGLLRGEMGFGGLVVTDDLEMDAVDGERDPVDAALQAIRAGADMALVGRNLKGEVALQDLVREVEAAVRRGALARERVESAFHRVAAFKAKWIPARWAPPSHEPSYREARRLAKELWSLDPGGGP